MQTQLPPTHSVLIVDDDYAIRVMLSEALEDAGYQVLSAENGSQALRLLRDESALPSVILLDLMMPVMNGWEFHTQQQADAALATIPVIVLSARPSLPNDAFMTSINEFMQKPVDIARLLKSVDRYCE